MSQEEELVGRLIVIEAEAAVSYAPPVAKFASVIGSRTTEQGTIDALLQ